MGRVLFATMIAAAPVLTVPLSQAASGAMHFAAPGPPANPQRTHVSLAGLSGPNYAGDTPTDAPQQLLQAGRYFAHLGWPRCSRPVNPSQFTGTYMYIGS